LEKIAEPTEEKIKWLWEQCGFTSTVGNDNVSDQEKWFYPEPEYQRLWYIPSVGSLEFLGFLFKYAVPAFRVRGKYPYITEIALEPTMCDEEIYYCHLQYSSMDEDGFVDIEDAHGSSEDPGVALFNALCEMLNYE